MAMLANYPFLVVVNNDLPAKSIKELVALLKSQPGKIDYASAGNTLDSTWPPNCSRS